MRLPAALLVALTAAACNSQGGNGQSAGSGAAPATVSMRPGLWESTTRVVAVDAPTAPAEARPELEAALTAPPTVESSCLTPAEAADLALAIRNRVLRDQPGYVCETGESLFANGRIRMTMSCRSTSGGPGMRQAMAGTYTAERMQLAVSAEGATPATPQAQSIPIRIETTLIGRRVGDCPAGGTN